MVGFLRFFIVEARQAASGKVLVTGGYKLGGTLASAELYDPATGSWSATGSLAAARDNHTATMLSGGKVLVTGGFLGTVALASAELYDPATGTWSATGSLAAARDNHTATMLSGGKVLVTGGFTGGWSGVNIASSELYDPVTGIWSATGSLATARETHAATLLPNGKVLVTGGFGGTAVLASTELYDPATGSWSATLNLATARNHFTATLLDNGKVLAVGGTNAGAPNLASAELY